MKLYKDYKLEQELKKAEERDKQFIGEDSKIVVIYEENFILSKIKTILGLIGLIIFLLLIASVVTLAAFYFTVNRS